jgi:nucleotide-binding universal stress UspA family protein
MPAAVRYRRVLVGVDFSPASRVALAHALHVAEHQRASVEVVHVVESFEPALPFLEANRRAVARMKQQEVSRAGSRLARFVGARHPVPVTTRVLSGKPDVAILERARRSRADLIVLSNRGRGLAEQLLIGTTAERVVRKGRLPVLLVPAPARSHRRR